MIATRCENCDLPVPTDEQHESTAGHPELCPCDLCMGKGVCWSAWHGTRCFKPTAFERVRKVELAALRQRVSDLELMPRAVGEDDGTGLRALEATVKAMGERDVLLANELRDHRAWIHPEIVKTRERIEALESKCERLQASETMREAKDDPDGGYGPHGRDEIDRLQKIITGLSDIHKRDMELLHQAIPIAQHNKSLAVYGNSLTAIRNALGLPIDAHHETVIAKIEEMQKQCP